jgi:hypothetical protein
MRNAEIWPMNAAFLREMVAPWAGAAASFTNAGTEDRTRKTGSTKAIIVANWWSGGCSRGRQAGRSLRFPVLGVLAVRAQDGATIFDFGKWHSSVASRRNDDGTTSFVSIDPTVGSFNFAVESKSWTARARSPSEMSSMSTHGLRPHLSNPPPTCAAETDRLGSVFQFVADLARLKIANFVAVGISDKSANHEISCHHNRCVSLQGILHAKRFRKRALAAWAASQCFFNSRLCSDHLYQ